MTTDLRKAAEAILPAPSSSQPVDRARRERFGASQGGLLRPEGAHTAYLDTLMRSYSFVTASVGDVQKHADAHEALKGHQRPAEHEVCSNSPSTSFARVRRPGRLCA